MRDFAKRKIHKIKNTLKPEQTMSLGFGIIILIGALLLNLPISSRDGQSIGIIDALLLQHQQYV